MIDNFTKVVLTVIAVALMILAVKTFRVVPTSVEAARGEIYQVDIRKIGGNYVFLSDLVKK